MKHRIHANKLLALLPGALLLLSLGFARAATPATADARVEREAIPALVNPATRSDLRATLDLAGEWDFAADPLALRYPGVTRLGTPEAATASLVVAANLLEPVVTTALEQGQNVLCLSLPGGNTLKPGTALGVWAPDGVSNQAGTAIADHPAFGEFPHGRFLDQGWFRLLDQFIRYARSPAIQPTGTFAVPQESP